MIVLFFVLPRTLGLKVLDHNYLGMGIVDINMTRRTWSWHDYVEKDVQEINFGEARKLAGKNSRWGTIAIFDDSDVSHLWAISKIVAELTKP